MKKIYYVHYRHNSPLTGYPIVFFKLDDYFIKKGPDFSRHELIEDIEANREWLTLEKLRDNLRIRILFDVDIFIDSDSLIMINKDDIL